MGYGAESSVARIFQRTCQHLLPVEQEKQKCESTT